MTRSLVPALVVAMVSPMMAVAPSPEDGHGPKTNATFEKLKGVLGTWEQEVEGKKVVALVSKLTSAGNVIQETMFPGTEHEMTNMYHSDGDAVVVTHYCAIGNQPRMKATKFEGDTITFSFVDGTNMKSLKDAHMGKLVLTMKGTDALVQDWTNYKDGKEAGSVKFEMSRKK